MLSARIQSSGVHFFWRQLNCPRRCSAGTLTRWPFSRRGKGTGAGVAIAGTVEGSAAESAGLVAGDTVTALDGTAVADASALTAAVQAHDAGDQVQLTWTDATGTSHTATVTLGEGPAA